MLRLPVCFECKHLINARDGKYKCKAFDEIPDNIASGEDQHETILPGQKGDYVFEKADDDA